MSKLRFSLKASLIGDLIWAISVALIMQYWTQCVGVERKNNPVNLHCSRLCLWARQNSFNCWVSPGHIKINTFSSLKLIWKQTTANREQWHISLHSYPVLEVNPWSLCGLNSLLVLHQVVRGRVIKPRNDSCIEHYSEACAWLETPHWICLWGRKAYRKCVKAHEFVL